MARSSAPAHAAALALVLTGGCGFFTSPHPSTPPPPGRPIALNETTAIGGAPGWYWIAFPDTVCTDATADASGRYTFGTSSTGLAISWGTSNDLVVFLQGAARASTS